MAASLTVIFKMLRTPNTLLHRSPKQYHQKPNEMATNIPNLASYLSSQSSQRAHHILLVVGGCLLIVGRSAISCSNAFNPPSAPIIVSKHHRRISRSVPLELHGSCGRLSPPCTLFALFCDYIFSLARRDRIGYS